MHSIFRKQTYFYAFSSNTSYELIWLFLIEKPLPKRQPLKQLGGNTSHFVYLSRTSCNLFFSEKAKNILILASIQIRFSKKKVLASIATRQKRYLFVLSNQICKIRNVYKEIINNLRGEIILISEAERKYFELPRPLVLLGEAQRKYLRSFTITFVKTAHTRLFLSRAGYVLGMESTSAPMRRSIGKILGISSMDLYRLE